MIAQGNESSLSLPAFDSSESRQRCLRYRQRILEISQTVSALHMAGAYSALEMMDAVYFGLLRRHADGTSPDTFVLSKGHGGIGLYAVLEHLGVLRAEDVDLYCKPGGKLGCHPDYGVAGIEASTGSLGHGMGLCVGMAHADRLLKQDRRVFVLMSDGEFQEGSVWESMMMGANLGLTNLIGLLDHNGMQSFGKTREYHPAFYPIREKIEAFGWESAEVDGHNTAAVVKAVSERKRDRPFLLICNTVKGRGISYMENQPIWHYRSPNPAEYATAISDLERNFNAK